ncbi:uncharacterized protein B0I36DRAFT_346284 [Microdochium trichocladiopsis]|uniref:Uncharacterized protein n=1 Tax=Microdochium trichocladiopsis TaxID=1682393 RepID=A0A9P8YHY6_9PEZI|nr:uncharacterized protein B0I36DRAFT_346284 [Microdochium trichocladiopsis]KAH7038289.1 hypothetical protein B0I36DRAFT_346284 [Microdochium trichocladiopsis]
MRLPFSSSALWATRLLVLVTTAGSLARAAEYCNNCTNESPEPILAAPAPWILTGRAYAIPIVPLSLDLPDKTFHPLERTVGNYTAGTFRGILGTILLVRYDDSPVGPYDEFIVIPGTFSYDKEGVEQLRLRIGRIYVSQKYTTWNGRSNWNIPKHLARFDWTSHPGGGESVKIYPYDTSGSLSSAIAQETGPSAKPFFSMTFAPTIPVQIPFTTDVFGWLGMEATTLGHPPIPEGNGVYDELPGTDFWAHTVFGLKGSKASLGLMDLRQAETDEVVSGRNAVGDEVFPNFWPGMPRWNVALKLTDAMISFSDPETWVV